MKIMQKQRTLILSALFLGVLLSRFKFFHHSFVEKY